MPETRAAGASLPEWLEIAMALAEADASTGWVMSHANICAGIIYASADPRLRDEFFADPNACAAWSSLPRVEAKEEADRRIQLGRERLHGGDLRRRHGGGALTARRHGAAAALVSEAGDR